jgi:hypothetical protein
MQAVLWGFDGIPVTSISREQQKVTKEPDFERLKS